MFVILSLQVIPDVTHSLSSFCSNEKQLLEWSTTRQAGSNGMFVRKQLCWNLRMDGLSIFWRLIPYLWIIRYAFLGFCRCWQNAGTGIIYTDDVKLLRRLSAAARCSKNSAYVPRNLLHNRAKNYENSGFLAQFTTPSANAGYTHTAPKSWMLKSPLLSLFHKQVNNTEQPTHWAWNPKWTILKQYLWQIQNWANSTITNNLNKKYRGRKHNRHG